MAAIRKSVKIVLAGLFNIDVNVLGATDADDKETAFKNLCLGPTGDPEHAHAPSTVRQRLECPVCKNDDREAFSKGREVSKGTYVVVDQEELAAAEVDESLKDQMQLTVHDADEVHAKTLPGEKVYFLEPGKGPLTVKAYNLLRDKIEDNPDKAFCTEWAARTKPGMFRLGTFGKAITIEQLAWPENIRSAPDVQEAEYSDADASMFDQLISTIEADFDPSTYRDDRKDQITALIAAAEAVEGVIEEKTGVPKVAQRAAAQMDLSSALASALAAAGATPAPAKTTAKKAPAKKAAAKKATPARKTA